MFRLVIIFFILNFYNPTFSSMNEKIISQMKLTNSLSFNFLQTIDEKNEKGWCTIKYPKKLYCRYINPNNKIIISNGKSLVIKNTNWVKWNLGIFTRAPWTLGRLRTCNWNWCPRTIWYTLVYQDAKTIK